uniref:hypothetical protein n=1 Tax=Enterococcus faecalis TaxID=1351 RepID=UPI003984F753
MQTSKNTSLIFGKYMNQQTLMKELHIGFDTLRILRLNGLEVITIGRQNLYDLGNLEVVLSQLKQTD